jgi:hypothetical protein
MDLGLALKAASAAPTTFSASSESDNGTAAHRPSGLRRADPNSGFAGDLSSTLASRPPRARPSSLDQREEHAASQPTAPSREHARSAVADAAFNGDLASVLSGARRQVSGRAVLTWIQMIIFMRFCGGTSCKAFVELLWHFQGSCVGLGAANQS